MTIITQARLALAVMLFLSTTTMAAPPDLTNGGVPGDTLTINLGPTGLRGWVYHVKTNTGESRQIHVKSVAAGSPADGILAVDDVILGADGTGADPVNFTSDARKSLADAIADAEARNPATLKLIRWRAGVTSTVDLTLQTHGCLQRHRALQLPEVRPDSQARPAIHHGRRNRRPLFLRHAEPAGGATTRRTRTTRHAWPAPRPRPAR